MGRKADAGRGMSLKTRRAINGYVFIIPWLIGFLVFFLTPIILSITFSFNKVTTSSTGYQLNWVGLANYHKALLEDTAYPQHLLNSSVSLITDVPIIVVFSFFVALLLKQKFRGSGLVKAVFFLPVIMSSGLFVDLQSNFGQATSSTLDAAMEASGGMLTVLSSDTVTKYLTEMGMPDSWLNYITGAIDSIYSIITNSGIQIFIFLAGLNSISPALYEASDIEGATGWEAFWKITFPMMTPMILVNVIYSIVDSFTSTGNRVMNYTYNLAFGSFDFGLSSAMSWIYFVILAVVMGVVAAVISRRTFYYT